MEGPKNIAVLVDFDNLSISVEQYYKTGFDLGKVMEALRERGRTIIRRAERLVVRLYDEGLIKNVELIRYLNRLSSLAFVLARYEDALSGQSAVRLAKGDD